MTEVEDGRDRDDTKFFYELTPERILEAVEDAGLRTTGRVMALNSMENRVHQVEIELDEEPESPSDRYRVVKFYRPGRWSIDQILDEHDFLIELAEEEIPAVAPVELEDGSTVSMIEGTNIPFSVFPRIGGRILEEPDLECLRRLGRLIARVHNVGARGDAPSRVVLDVESYGRSDLDILEETGYLPASVADRYFSVVDSLLDRIEPWFDDVAIQRLHGDCHLGNVLEGSEGLFLVDFDDMVTGPCVQDLWLIEPGSDDRSVPRREALLDGYEQLRELDRTTFRLIEPLRAMRVVHFSAWIAKRWEDPAFPRVFPDFVTERYWFDELNTLTEMSSAITEAADGLF